MQPEKEIHVRYLPTLPPVGLTAVSFLLLDRFQASGWVWGVVGTFAVCAWVSVAVRMAKVKWVKPSEI